MHLTDYIAQKNVIDNLSEHVVHIVTNLIQMKETLHLRMHFINLF